MRAVDLIRKEMQKVSELTAKYCGKCQECDCDYCPFEVERSEE